jgi:hypothetical protein
MCSAHFIFLDLINPIAFGEEYTLSVSVHIRHIECFGLKL